MTAGRLARAQLARPTVRALALMAFVVAAWLAWSPGTRSGLPGAYGGWIHVSGHLLDAGLLPTLVGGALAGAAPRETSLDDYLRAAGLEVARVLRLAVVSGALVAAAIGLAFVGGAAAGGVLRSISRGGSWWAEPGAAPAAGSAAVTDLRLLLAVALAGALGAIVGWLVRREDLAAGLAVLLGIGYLPELSAVLRRLPSAIDALAFTPVGTLRTAALGDRGLAAAGFARPGAPGLAALVLAGWFAVLVVLALPSPRRGRSRPLAAGHGPPRSLAPARRRARRPSARAAGLVAVATLLTVAFGAVVPSRTEAALPWRWQRSWRAAERQGWSSTQTVDRFLETVRAAPPGDADPLLAGPASAPAQLVESIRRADQVDRQPESTMRGPERVIARLRFDQPIVSGPVAFSEYLVRFTLEPDETGRWSIVEFEGPVAVGATAAGVEADR